MHTTHSYPQVIAHARAAARKCGNDFIGPQHFVIGAEEERSSIAWRILQQLINDPVALDKVREHYTENGSSITIGSLPYLSETRSAIAACETRANHQDGQPLNSGHLLFEILKNAPPKTRVILSALGIDVGRLGTLVDLLDESEP